MPLLDIDELETISPVFQGALGNAFGHFLMKILSVNKVNELYDRYASLTGPDFSSAVLKDIGVEYEVIGRHVLDNLPDGPFIIISNHPYGSIDGIMMVDLFGQIRPDLKVIVNKFLSRIETLSDNFISVTPTKECRTAPTPDNIQGIKEAVCHVRDGHPLGIFPSGAVSDLSIKDRCIRDREWQESVIRLIKKLNVPIVPVHFLDRNSNLYYVLGLLFGWKVRTLRLPAEVFNKRGKRTRMAIGEIITSEQQAEYADLDAFRAFLRSKVYDNVK